MSNIEYIKNARILTNFIIELNKKKPFLIEVNINFPTHVGGLVTDVILQSGLNYQFVVKPRVKNIIQKYPQAKTIKFLKELIEKEGTGKLLNWKHPEKINRFNSFVEFAIMNHLNTCSDIRNFVLYEGNNKKLLSIRGFGPKSLDYLKKLLCIDTIAVDRHINNFVSMANIDVYDYSEMKHIVEYASDLLKITRVSLDTSIWNYMSNKYYEIHN